RSAWARRRARGVVEAPPTAWPGQSARTGMRAGSRALGVAAPRDRSLPGPALWPLWSWYLARRGALGSGGASGVWRDRSRGALSGWDRVSGAWAWPGGECLGAAAYLVHCRAGHAGPVCRGVHLGWVVWPLRDRARPGAERLGW